MKSLAFLLPLSVMADEHQFKFMNFAAKYGKSYKSVEHHKERFEVFRKNLEKAE